MEKIDFPIVFIALALLMVVLPLLVGCDKEKDLPVEVPLEPPKDTFTIMSYNVLEGAGTSEPSADYRQNHGFKPNALEDVIRIIKYYNPDIIGIQEAVRWEANDDAIAKYLSKELKMNYILAPGWFPEWNVLLLTRFEIIDYKLFTSEFRIGALRATLKINDSDSLTVYNFHLSVPEHYKDLNSFNDLFSEFEQVKYGIAVGDFNELSSNLNFPSNWRTESHGIDQIWITTSIGLAPSGKYFGITILPDQNIFEFGRISDHFPVIYKTGIY